VPNNVWPFAELRPGESMNFTIPMRSLTRTRFRSALCQIKRRKGFSFRVEYLGAKITVTRLRETTELPTKVGKPPRSPKK
jgi:hypothetical protein